MRWGWKGWTALSLVGLGILSSSVWHNVTPRVLSGKAHTQSQPLRQQAVIPNKKGDNAAYVAGDVSRTAAICVRDCRSLLHDLSDHLTQTNQSSQRQMFMQQAIRQHPQFLSLTWIRNTHVEHSGENPLRPELQKEAIQTNAKDQYYVSDLYKTNRTGVPIAMTIGVPVIDASHHISTLVADVNMDHVMQVAALQDRQFGTSTQLFTTSAASNRGATVMNEESRPASTSVQGTHWTVRVQQTPSQAHIETARVRNQVLVQFSRDLTSTDKQEISRTMDGTFVRSNSRHTYVFESNSMSTATMLQYFKQYGAILAEPHTVYRTNQYGVGNSPIEEPNDTFYATNQWNMIQIGADLAWAKSTGSSNVTVAVVDTGVDLSHPDLRGRFTNGTNIIDSSKSPQDDNGHGTHVAGIIGARTNNSEGVAGINWQSKIMPVKVMGKDGTGSVVDIADGVVWAADHGANVINLSLGEYEDSAYLHNAIQYAYKKGVVIVCAMGNDATNKPCYPAAYPEVIAVAADDDTEASANFSNYGPNTSVTAPGVSIPSTYPNQHYVMLSGTSMASPHVAGVAALIKSVNPNLSPDDVRKILQQTADDLGPAGKDDHYGYGQVNVNKAIVAAQSTLTK